MTEITLPPGVSQKDLERILKCAAKKESSGEGYVEFAKVDYGNGNELRVYRDIYKDRETFSVRRFYTDKNDGTLKPGKGVTFHDEDIDDLIEGLENMRSWLEQGQVSTERFEQGDG